ncbi:MAG TPA: DUF3179 domain-containing protein, partial [Anaerolineae bacterium]|nr:DUF3179 domain-containing protein [Anaerolineae bacterium]
AQPTPSPANTPNPAPTSPPAAPPTGAPVNDKEAAQLLQDLLTSSSGDAGEAIARIQETGDARFIPVLIELLRARQIGLYRGLGYAEIIETLELLSGQSLNGDWAAWVEWYGGTELEPPPGFTGWKGILLSGIDPGFGEFLQDEYPARLRVEEIVWGGVKVDGIPALDNPEMLTAVEADYLNPWDVVFGIAINGDARAYPLRILDWHEMANDVIGGVPVSLAYCTLCGAAIAYDGRSTDADGQPITYDFGSSGFLYRSNKLMYDRQTRTLWNQLTGQPVLGPLAGSDLRLELLPVVLTTWEAWLAEHPDTLVVDIDTGYDRDYEPGSAYGAYFSDTDTMFPVWQRNDGRAAKDQIYALNVNDTPKAYPLDILTEAQAVNDTLGGVNLVLLAGDEIFKVDGDHWLDGPVQYKAGAEVRAFERADHTFSLNDEGNVVDEDGRVWQISEEALTGPDGEQLPRINGHLAYWFGWYAFYPDTLLYKR